MMKFGKHENEIFILFQVWTELSTFRSESFSSSTRRIFHDHQNFIFYLFRSYQKVDPEYHFGRKIWKCFKLLTFFLSFFFCHLPWNFGWKSNFFQFTFVGRGNFLLPTLWIWYCSHHKIDNHQTLFCPVWGTLQLWLEFLVSPRYRRSSNKSPSNFQLSIFWKLFPLQLKTHWLWTQTFVFADDFCTFLMNFTSVGSLVCYQVFNLKNPH